MWPYTIHFRSKIFLYLAILTLVIFIWHFVLRSNDVRLTPSNQMPYVDFKHLLIACILAAEKGGHEVVNARRDLTINVKGKTKEGLDDVLTNGDKRSNMVMVNSMLYTIPGIKIISEENLQNDDIIELLNIEKHLNSPEYSSIPDDIQFNLDDLVVWIDPLDATKEYSEGLTEYVTTMVCISRNGEPIIGVIHQPFESKTYWASKFGIDKKLMGTKFDHHANRADSKNQSLRIIISRSHAGDVKKWLHQNRNLPNLTITEAAGSGYKTLQLLKGEADIYLHKTYIKKWDVCAPDVLLRYSSKGLMTTLDGKRLDYGFQTDVLNEHGIFATNQPELIHWREKMANPS